MHRGYILKYKKFDTYLYEVGKKLYKQHNKKIQSRISEFRTDGLIDGSKLSSDWFPEIEADIFISHSHKDEKYAITLCGWLWEKFQILGFVDSLVWKKYTTLLKEIDEIYCTIPGTKSFNYEKRNYSTSHVHMMLSIALTRMIDNTECLFFLNTENSITLENVLAEKPYTISPWIYSELEISKLVRRRTLLDHRAEAITESVQKSLSFIPIKYNASINHLTKLHFITLLNWEKQKFNGSKEALDFLYNNT